MTILVAHMSDLHFCQKNLEESSRTFGFSVDDAIRKQVGAAIITGDSTDHALEAHDTALLALAGHLKRLADHCPVLMLQGTFSHEPPGVLDVLKMIGAKHAITIADRIGMFGLTQEGFEPFQNDTDYDLAVTAFPTVNRADLVGSMGSVTAAGEMGDLLFELMQEFGRTNSSLNQRGIPTMLIGHGTVHECETEHGVPMAGPDHEFGVGALFSARCDVAALGHIHKHQVWRRENQILAYAGSIGRFHHGEEGDKHYLLWRMEPGNASYEAVVTPSRRTVDIVFDGVPDMKVIADAVQKCAGAYVRIRYCVDEESKHVVNREAIRAVLADACDLQIEGKTLVIERQRAPGISTATSLAAKLKTWCDVTKSEAGPLLERLEFLQSQQPEDIAAEIMKGIKNEIEKKSTVGNAVQPVEPGRIDGDGIRSEGNAEGLDFSDENGVDEPEWMQFEDGLFA